MAPFARVAALLFLSPLYASGVGIRARALRPHRPESGWTVLPWKKAREMANSTALKLNESELMSVVRGAHFSAVKLNPEHGYYKGNTVPVERFGIPALKMQDSSQGFSPTEPREAGTTTSFPCLLALSATWDEELTERMAAAIGKEFAGKGANVLLGPDVSVNRVARYGRQFESLAGDDPFLGKKLAFRYVSGVQSQGVMATVKHFAFGQQETYRTTEDSQVDERTAWELYYPPFAAAVEAGAGAVMCAYNKVNGTYACENEDLLQRDLRERMGFQGMVISDWGATKSAASFLRGMDMDMPGGGGLISNFLTSTSKFQMRKHLEDPMAAMQRAAVNVLTAIYHMRFHEKPGCQPPNCISLRAVSLKNSEHSQVALDVATSSVVLLKNEGGLLPLDPGSVKSLAVLGAPCNATAIKSDDDKDYYSGGGSGHVPALGAKAPMLALRERAAKAGVEVLTSPAAGSVCVVFGATTAMEAFDRGNLELDNEREVEAAVEKCEKTVVLMQTPGAVLMPWRNKVAAIASLFLAGEETSNAWAAVLFGDATPSGKLPIAFPATLEDTISPAHQRDIPYTEGLFTSYRSTSLQFAYPFGHGLSYATFEYGKPELRPKCRAAACIELTVTNTHAKYAGREVVQAYLHFGKVPEYPKLLLRGFHKTKLLQPGKSEKVVFNLSPRDVSIYRSEGGWAPQRNVEVHVGASSADIRHVLPVRVKL